MTRTISRLLITATGLMNLGVTGYFVMHSWEMLSTLPALPREVASIDPAAAGGHGGASDHAAPKTDAHGAPIAADPHSARLRSWVTLDEMFVNVLSASEVTHTLAFKLEVELFDENARGLMEERQAVIKNAVIETGREQEFESLKTLAGKLYFKEALVNRINQTVKFPLIRDIHLASFSLR